MVLNLWTRETFNDEPFIVTPELFNKPYGVPDSVERANLGIVAVFVTVETTDLDRPIQTRPRRLPATQLTTTSSWLFSTASD